MGGGVSAGHLTCEQAVIVWDPDDVSWENTWSGEELLYNTLVIPSPLELDLHGERKIM
jgi:hypothetical protein